MPRHEHRDLEEALDRLPSVAEAAFHSGFTRTFESFLSHYSREEVLYPGPRFAKMRDQHLEVREIGAEVLRSLETGQQADAGRLLQRFVALARHNMIEEERDVFPYYHQE